MFETEIIENIGRSICAFVLHIIEDSVNNEVIILAGNNMHGSYGFCAARHLLNHNVKVKIFFFEEKLELMHEVYLNLNFFQIFISFNFILLFLF